MKKKVGFIVYGLTYIFILLNINSIIFNMKNYSKYSLLLIIFNTLAIINLIYLFCIYKKNGGFK